jgi:hypothetical protein
VNVKHRDVHLSMLMQTVTDTARQFPARFGNRPGRSTARVIVDRGAAGSRQSPAELRLATRCRHAHDVPTAGDRQPTDRHLVRGAPWRGKATSTTVDGNTRKHPRINAATPVARAEEGMTASPTRRHRTVAASVLPPRSSSGRSERRRGRRHHGTREGP